MPEKNLNASKVERSLGKDHETRVLACALLLTSWELLGQQDLSLSHPVSSLKWGVRIDDLQGSFQLWNHDSSMTFTCSSWNLLFPLLKIKALIIYSLSVSAVCSRSFPATNLLIDWNKLLKFCGFVTSPWRNWNQMISKFLSVSP